MSITAIGTFQNWHYQQLTPTCRIMRCERAGVNVDYFTLLLRVAGLSAVVHPKEVIEDPEYMDMLGNGTADAGFALRRMDPAHFSKVNFALPITGVTYGYIVKEDRTEIRDSFMDIIFDESIIIFAACSITVNVLGCLYSGLDIIKEVLKKAEVKSIRSFITSTRSSYSAIWLLQRERSKSVPLSSRILLSFYLPATIFFSNIFQSQITSVLVSDEVKGYDFASFSMLLDKLEWEDYNALIWPYFPLKVYCKDEECVKWNELKSIGAISLPEKNDAYFKQLAEGSKLVGFASIGDELLRGDVVVYNRRDRLLFIADQNLCEQPFSFMISKKRKDLVEVFNRAIAMTSSVYPRMMTRYLSPYGVYSEKIHNMEVSQLTLSNFEPVWQFFAVCTAIVMSVFIAELIVGKCLYVIKRK